VLATLLLGVASAACGGSELEVSSGPGPGEPPPGEAAPEQTFSPDPPPTGTPDTLPSPTSSSSSSTSTSSSSSTSTTTPGGTVATVPEDTTPTTDAQGLLVDPGAAEQSVAFVNQKRAENDRPPLTMDPELRADAEAWARQMAIDQNMRHDPNRGATMPDRYPSWGENVAYGYEASRIDQAWWDSEGHRANILGRQYQAVGIAFVRDRDGTFWAVQIFGG
jgi:uncharacterized protein YkwD